MKESVRIAKLIAEEELWLERTAADYEEALIIADHKHRSFERAKENLDLYLRLLREAKLREKEEA